MRPLDLLLTVACLATALLLMTGSALASHDPSGEPVNEDFVIGVAGVAAANECSIDGCLGVTLDAHSGPLGENAFGSAS